MFHSRLKIVLAFILFLISYFSGKGEISGKINGKIECHLKLVISEIEFLFIVAFYINPSIFEDACNDLEAWCSFAKPDCNQARARAACPKSCNICIGKCIFGRW